MSRRGNYIVIEGIDGSGKTTQFNHMLAHVGSNAIGVREPGGTPMAERIRLLLKDRGIPRTGMTNTLLLAAARADLIDTTIRPAIEAGRHVIADRNWLSTFAYQSAEGVDTEHIKQLNRMATGEFFTPDLLILLDIDPEICRQRTHGRGGAEADYFDSKGTEYFNRVRSGYLKGAAEIHNTVTIDANGTPEEVWSRIKEVLQDRRHSS